MPTVPPDSDAVLESLQDDLRSQLAAVNDLHHPVYPGSPKRIAELERHIADLRVNINARKSEIAKLPLK